MNGKEAEDDTESVTYPEVTSKVSDNPRGTRQPGQALTLLTPRLLEGASRTGRRQLLLSISVF